MKKLPTVHLFGDLKENFYQLGLKDRERANLIHAEVKDLLKTPYPIVNKILEEVAKGIIKNTKLKNSSFQSILIPYAEGLGVPLEELILINSIPEMVSGMSQWAPGLKLSNFGCTSIFLKNLKGHPVHFRILDFPLTKHYQENERMILYDFKEFPKTLAFNAIGIPYPSITLMNEYYTLALHQKFTNVFDPKNESIFEIIFELLQNAFDLNTTLSFLKNKKSMTTWSLYMSFKNGDVLAYDIMGEKSSYKTYTLDSGPICFHNELIDENIIQENFLPYGFSEFNRLRRIISDKKLDQLKKSKKLDNQSILKILSTPEIFNQLVLDDGFDIITPTSITVKLMDPADAEVLYNSGEVPRFYDRPIQIRQCFNDPLQEFIKVKPHPLNHDYHQALQSVMKAQKAFDDKNSLIIYHELQMAQDHLPDGSLKTIFKFYFLVAQYIYEHHKKSQLQLLLDFNNIKDKLPPYLKDQACLFISRLEKILDQPVTILVEDIKNENLKKIFRFELNMPRAIFHITQKQFIIPRIDILDVIYVYSH